MIPVSWEFSYEALGPIVAMFLEPFGWFIAVLLGIVLVGAALGMFIRVVLR